MADHKFTYTVSGVDLSEAQRARISQHIAAAVTSALIGEGPAALTTDYLTLHRVYGGRWIPAAAAETIEGIDSVGVGK